MPEATPAARPTLLVFQSSVLDDASSLEKLVVRAQQAATIDLLKVASGTDLFESAIIVSEDERFRDSVERLSEEPGGLHIEVDRSSGAEFHFGAVLRSVCERHRLERVVYIGGGAMPLASESDLRDLAATASARSPAVCSNNLYSADAVGFWPASALTKFAPSASDNNLAWLLHFKAGLFATTLPRSLSSTLDIDTPSDLAAIWYTSQAKEAALNVGEALGRVLEELPDKAPALASNVAKLYVVMSTRTSELLVAGRVSSWVWRRLEANLPCQTRIFSEERGMRASGREERGEAHSLLGFFAEQAGVNGLVDVLAQIASGACVDTRVLFAHRGLKLLRSDRFASDALMPEFVKDAWARSLTEAVLQSPIPILFGGHSLVSGGIWALSERVRAESSSGS